MFRLLTAPSAWEFGKWCAYALILLVPGSLIVFPVWWLLKEMRGGLDMNDRESTGGALPETKPERLVKRFRIWWRSRDTVEEYLAGATDHGDLERRLQVLERASGGPAFVTFNH